MSTTKRAEETLDRLRAILTYYGGPGRQKGHTTAILNGARNSRGSVVVVHDHEMAARIRRLTEGKTPTVELLEFGERTRGHAAPILWDNAALYVLLTECADAIGDLLEEIARPETGPIHDAAQREAGE